MDNVSWLIVFLLALVAVGLPALYFGLTYLAEKYSTGPGQGDETDITL